MTNKWRIIIIGAAGRDFHNFNVVFRKDRRAEVVAFTAAQIPGIANRIYPASLAGRLYPNGIPIEDEKGLEKLIKEKGVNECILSYTDLSYDSVMRLASRVMAAGAKFSILGPDQTMLKSAKPVIAVLAVRTGCGKSQTSRRIVEILHEAGKKVVSVRHPMPYGDLAKQKLQRFKTMRDLQKHECTIEEIEEYEPHIAMGSTVFAGVDYAAILKKAEKEGDVIIWDGGNNDTSFYKPDLIVTVADPFRAGHEIQYFAGEINFRCADVILINKVNTADSKNVDVIVKNAEKYNPSAKIIKAESIIEADDASIIKGKKVLVVEDGPTLTHGGMKIGAGMIAARQNGAASIVDPRPYATGSIKETFEKYPHIDGLLPAMGYGNQQMKELEETINRAECDAVIIGTPIDLARYIAINKPHTRVRYELSEDAKNKLKEIMRQRKLI